MVSASRIREALRDVPHPEGLEDLLIEMRNEVDALDERIRKLEQEVHE